MAFVIVVMLIFLLQFAPHFAAIAMYNLFGTRPCASSLATWLLVVGIVGLFVHLYFWGALGLKKWTDVRTVGARLEQAQMVIAFVFVGLLFVFIICSVIFVRTAQELHTYDAEEFFALASKNTSAFATSGVVPPADTNFTTARGLAAAVCNRNFSSHRESLSSTDAQGGSACTYVASACDVELWWGAYILSWFWAVVGAVVVFVLFGAAGITMN